MCAILAAALAFLYLQSAKNAIETKQNTANQYGERGVDIYVAARSINSGEIIDEGDLEQKKWDRDLLPEQTLVDKEEIIGKSALNYISKNSPIAQSLVEQINSFTVPEGKVALSVTSANVRAVGGSLRPGMIVDVYSNIEQVSLLASQVEVLQTSNQSQLQGRQPSKDLLWVTIALDPELVEPVIAAEASKTLYFSLPSEVGA